MKASARVILPLLLLVLGGSLFLLPTSQAEEGEWVFVGYDFHSYFESLPSYGMWHFNTTLGSGERWAINVSLSCVGFRHVTVLVCDDAGYQEWQQEGTTTNCILAENTSRPLDATVTFPHGGSWHLVLNNTGILSQLIGVIICRYRWSAVAPPLDFLNLFGEGLVWLFCLLVIACVVIPCVCRTACRNN